MKTRDQSERLASVCCPVILLGALLFSRRADDCETVSAIGDRMLKMRICNSSGTVIYASDFWLSNFSSFATRFAAESYDYSLSQDFNLRITRTYVPSSTYCSSADLYLSGSLESTARMLMILTLPPSSTVCLL